MGNRPELSTDALLGLLEVCGDGAFLVDTRDWQGVYANSALLRLVGQSFEVWQAGDPLAAFPDLASSAARQRMEEVASGKAAEIRLLSRVGMPAGRVTPIELRVKRVKSAGRIYLTCAATKIVVETRTPAEPSPLRTDPLTGLADRAFFLERLGGLLKGERADDRRCAVLFVDVDGFKQVNDSFGHLVGDSVLREVARRLAACVRTGDHVARFGGDEFVVLLEGARGISEVQPVVERIQTAFLAPIALPNGEVTLTVSVGIAEAGSGAGSAEELINAADRAMYAAKHAAT